MNAYAVMIRWVNSTPNPMTIDRALSPVGNWFRYNAHTWFVQASGPKIVHSALRPSLSTCDSILIVRIDPNEIDGWAPAEAWNWLRSRQNPLLNALPRDGNAMLP